MANNPPVISGLTVVAPVLVTTVVAPANVPAIVFALIPGIVYANNIIDLNSKLRRDLYNKAISAITIPFDGNLKNINLLQSQLLRSSENSGWNSDSGDTLTLPDGGGVDKNVLTEHGYVSETKIRVSAIAYIGTQAR